MNLADLFAILNIFLRFLPITKKKKTLTDLLTHSLTLNNHIGILIGDLFSYTIPVWEMLYCTIAESDM